MENNIIELYSCELIGFNEEEWHYSATNRDLVFISDMFFKLAKNPNFKSGSISVKKVRNRMLKKR